MLCRSLGDYSRCKLQYTILELIQSTLAFYANEPQNFIFSHAAVGMYSRLQTHEASFASCNVMLFAVQSLEHELHSCNKFCSSLSQLQYVYRC